MRAKRPSGTSFATCEIVRSAGDPRTNGGGNGNHVIADPQAFHGHGTPEASNRSPSVSTPRTLRGSDLAPFSYIVRTAHPGAVMLLFLQRGRRSSLLTCRRHFAVRSRGMIVSDDGEAAAGTATTLPGGPRPRCPRPAGGRAAHLQPPSPGSFPSLGEASQGAWWHSHTARFTGTLRAAHADLASAKAELPGSRALALQAARESIVLLEERRHPAPGRGAHRNRRDRLQRPRCCLGKPFLVPFSLRLAA